MIKDRNQASLRYFFLKLSVILLTFSCFGITSVKAEDRVVRIGVYENAPKVFTSESGKPSGIFIDIIEDIAKSEGWKLQYVSGTWTEGLDRLARGEIDLMPDVAYTAEREKMYTFNKVPVLSSWSQVYARKSNNIQSILDLNGKKLLVLENSIQQETFDRLSYTFGLSINIIPVPDLKTMFEMVAKGKADAAITNRFYGLMHAKQYGLVDTAVIFDPTILFFAAPKNDPKHLLDTIDSHVSAMKKDSQSVYYASLKQWTTEEVHFKLPAWLELLGLIVGIVLLMSIAGSFILKHQINMRTRELQAAQQRFMDIVEFLPDATFVIDQDKKIIAWNHACETMTGVKKESLLGQSNYAYAEPFFGERRPILIDLLDQPMPEMEAIYKYVLRESDRLYAESFIPHFKAGQGAHLWGVALPLYDKDGRRCGAIETIRDVTEQRHMEEALRSSEREYRELVMLANSIILRWSRDGRITFLNEFGQRFFGYTETEIIGKHVIGTIVPENESMGRDLHPLIEEICADPHKFERNINENIRRNGERVWIDWTNKLVFDEQGQIKEILSIGLDITDRKKAEEQVRRLNDDLRRHSEVLEQRVEERTAELVIAKDRAESADRIKSAFLATMSHELRTPLNSIIGFTGIMLQGLAGPLNEEQHKQMTMVQTSSRHLLSLINDVLDISKIEAGQLDLSPAPFDLRPSIEKIVKLVSPLAEQKGIYLQIDIPDIVEMITTDQHRLEQVILNLLNNAIKFTEKGRVSISCRFDYDQCLLSVSDTGIGMRPEDIPNLFQPFHQIDSGLTRKHEGTGLGLSICKKLMDMMGGSIDVESKWGKGSTFTVYIPKPTGGLP
jgi:PAS domain S-box-containing protein